MHVPVADLVGHPGATRSVHETVDRADVGDPDESWGPADDSLVGPFELDLHLDSVVEGILVRGTVIFDLEVPCARCSEPVGVHREAEVTELFTDPRKLDPDDEPDPGYELSIDTLTIDLETMLRDVVLLDYPFNIHCEDGCEVVTSEDVSLRTEDEDAQIRESTPDPRWAKLADLDLPSD